ncbi:MAG TPA: ATP-binding cassette domain-containing protein [Dongiaceae bacterium]|nr:ATP-binding cassette domain-containing protein [Dongiaceae bacterium]
MIAVEFDEVTISLGGRPVLSRVSLAMEEGELIGVLGPNGSGKTTLMRSILGLIAPAGGSIRVLGAPARRGNPAIGYMPQARGGAVGLRLSGRDFVASAVAGHRWGLPGVRAAERREVDRVLGLVDAADLARRPLSEMSGGERQRLVFAQALLGRPRLLLLDEPLISLDPHHQRAVVALARAVQRDLGITVLFSAHDINPLLEALDRVLYLGGGQAALGRVEEVITGEVLSQLYGAEIDVLRMGRRIFVMSGEHDLERTEHRHDARL